jgi:hypothetical protein
MNEEKTPFNAGDANHVAQRQKSKKTRDLQARTALRDFLGTPGGRIWMWDLLSLCGAFRLSFSTDALVMAFNEGRRDVGNHLIGEINRLSPEFYMKMALENQEKTE